MLQTYPTTLSNSLKSRNIRKTVKLCDDRWGVRRQRADKRRRHFRYDVPGSIFINRAFEVDCQKVGKSGEDRGYVGFVAIVVLVVNMQCFRREVLFVRHAMALLTISSS